MSKSMTDTSYILANSVIFSTLKHTDPHTVGGRSAQKDDACNEHIFRKGSFRELKIAKTNDLADLVKVLPESYQWRSYQNHDKDKVRRIQTLGNVILALVIALLDFVSKVIQIFVYEIRHSLARHDTSKEVNSSFSLLLFFFVISCWYQTLISLF